ncbi:MAG: hypothetical protein M0R37_14885 [Bacteroidales bacterium]|jgi:hypothetical protein|nr:hypothetical protein [Bacteroidales bacterium]
MKNATKKIETVTEREAEIWDAVYVVAHEDARERGLRKNAATAAAINNANAEIVRLRLHEDTAINTLEQADAIVDALGCSWAALTDGRGPQFREMGAGMRINSVRDQIARATSDDERAFAVRHYLAVVTDQRDNAHRMAAPRRF